MISRVSVADQIYAALRQNIVQGSYSPGQRVIEAQVAKTFAVSRAPVREAVNRLLQEGLLEARTHHGPSVVHLTPETMRDLYELRAAIESLAIRKIAVRAGTVNVAPLRECIAEMDRCAAKGDLAGVVDAEMQWTAPIEWSGLNVSAWSASGPSGRWFPALGGGIARRCAA